MKKTAASKVGVISAFTVLCMALSCSSWDIYRQFNETAQTTTSQGTQSTPSVPTVPYN